MINKIFNLLQYLRRIFYKITQLETKGVRVLIYKDEKILLVKHRYYDVWVMPGGKMNKGESPEQAARKELAEEVGIIPENFEYQLGVYKNTTGGKNDTVYTYVLTHFKNIKDFKRTFINWIEVKEMKWFYILDLPEKTTRATMDRITEFKQGLKNQKGDW